MELFEIANGNRIEEGGMGGFIVKGNKILLAKYKGKYYAIDARCPHMGGDLCEGTIEGKYVICPRHQRKTDITNGSHNGRFSLSFLTPDRNKIRSYRVIMELDKVKIEL